MTGSAEIVKANSEGPAKADRTFLLGHFAGIAPGFVFGFKCSR